MRQKYKRILNKITKKMFKSVAKQILKQYPHKLTIEALGHNKKKSIKKITIFFVNFYLLACSSHRNWKEKLPKENAEQILTKQPKKLSFLSSRYFQIHIEVFISRQYSKELLRKFSKKLMNEFRSNCQQSFLISLRKNLKEIDKF